MTRSRRVRRKTQWLLGANLTCGIPLTIQRCDTEVSDPDVFSVLLAPATQAALGNVGEANEVTVVRLVGAWAVRATVIPPSGKVGIAALHIAEGMYIADLPSAAAGVVLDPSDAGDLVSKDWMWLRTRTRHFGYSGPNCSTVDFGAQTSTESDRFDVKVKRKLRADEAILYSVAVFLDPDPPAGCTTTGAQLSVTEVVPWIVGESRALVMLP